MTTFGQRFNQWLIEQGKEPVNDEVVEALNEAATNTAAFIRRHQKDFVKEIQLLGADLAAGKQVDPKARARKLLNRLESQCSECSQVDTGQTGEYPCSRCGLPLVWDDQE